MSVAVICEFNPFHYGHRYLIQKARELTGETVIAVMSGSFTQRGEAAICSKFERAKTALQNGVDVVAELPAVYAVAAAQRFAGGGVAVASAFESVRYLAFGCETDDLALLQAAADAADHSRVNDAVAKEMKNGAYYPRALEQAVRMVLGDGVADVLREPNNILAVEYLRALKGTGVKPLPIKRRGTAHDSDKVSGNFASASKIREMLRTGEPADKLLPCVPDDVTEPQYLERAALYRLRMMTAAEWAALPEVEEGLENRLVEAVKGYNSIEEILSAVKTKRYTHARLRRIIACALLGITEALQAQPAAYVRVLGFSDAGEALLRGCRLPVVTSAAKAMKSKAPFCACLEKDILATDIQAISFKEIKPCGADYYTKIIRQNSAK